MRTAVSALLVPRLHFRDAPDDVDAAEQVPGAFAEARAKRQGGPSSVRPEQALIDEGARCADVRVELLRAQVAALLVAGACNKVKVG